MKNTSSAKPVRTSGTLSGADSTEAIRARQAGERRLSWIVASAPIGTESASVNRAMRAEITKPATMSGSSIMARHQRSDRPCGGKVR